MSFLERLRRQATKQPKYLYGGTNNYMALVSQKFGFEIEHVDPDTPMSRYFVHGETATVKQKLGEFLEKTDKRGIPLIDRLRERGLPK